MLSWSDYITLLSLLERDRDFQFQYSMLIIHQQRVYIKHRVMAYHWPRQVCVCVLFRLLQIECYDFGWNISVMYMCICYLSIYRLLIAVYLVLPIVAPMEQSLYKINPGLTIPLWKLDQLQNVSHSVKAIYKALHYKILPIDWMIRTFSQNTQSFIT